MDVNRSHSSYVACGSSQCQPPSQVIPNSNTLNFGLGSSIKRTKCIFLIANPSLLDLMRQRATSSLLDEEFSIVLSWPNAQCVACSGVWCRKVDFIALVSVLFRVKVVRPWNNTPRAHGGQAHPRKTNHGKNNQKQNAKIPKNRRKKTSIAAIARWESAKHS